MSINNVKSLVKQILRDGKEYIASVFASILCFIVLASYLYLGKGYRIQKLLISSCLKP